LREIRKFIRIATPRAEANARFVKAVAEIKERECQPER
jgi:histidinol-phosphate/aromatic aminotransferase/cobyric acid decarboxylase-like protein